MRSGFLSLAVFCLVPLVGCYSVSSEVISASQGEALPYTYTESNMTDGGKLYLTRTGNYNDYHFRQLAKDGTVSNEGTLRAIHIKGTVYAIQADEDDSGLNILFYQVTSDTFSSVDPANMNEVDALASRYGVTRTGDDLSGSAANILSFVRAHSELDFVRKVD